MKMEEHASIGGVQNQLILSYPGICVCVCNCAAAMEMNSHRRNEGTPVRKRLLCAQILYI